MTKTGDKLLRGAREAVEVARGNVDMIRRIRVTPSCGCVFCDIKLPVVMVDGKPHHQATDGQRRSIMVECGVD